MIRSRYIPPLDPKRQKMRTQMLTVRRFQYRYAVYLMWFSVIMSLVIGGITLFLLNHNYQILIRTELVASPRIVDNIYQELRLANEIIVGAYIGFIIFMTMVGVKFSHSIAVPIFLIQEKMRAVCRGDMGNAKVRIRYSDQFQEFAETYNYMVQTLTIQLKQDIEKLKVLRPHEQNRDAIHIWQTMLDEKQAQLTESGTSSPDPAPALHHAS